MKTLLFATVLMLAGCEKSAPKCPYGTNETKTHRWGNWEDTAEKSISGTSWLKRRCENCGWQEERGAKTP